MPRKKGGDNKSEAIRVILRENPRAKPREIVKTLGEKGINVSAQFVSTIKTKFKESKGKSRGADGEPPRRGRPPGRTAGRPAASASSGLSISGLLQVKDLVNKLGGISKAKEALAALEQIVG